GLLAQSWVVELRRERERFVRTTIRGGDVAGEEASHNGVANQRFAAKSRFVARMLGRLAQQLQQRWAVVPLRTRTHQQRLRPDRSGNVTTEERLEQPASPRLVARLDPVASRPDHAPVPV